MSVLSLCSSVLRAALPLPRMRRSLVTTATPVSSHEVSMPTTANGGGGGGAGGS